MFDGPSGGRVGVDITTGPDGNLWFMESQGFIGRMTTDGVITEFATGDDHTSRIIAGLDLDLWFIGNDPIPPGDPFATKGRIRHITTDGVVSDCDGADTSGLPTDIALGADRNVWFTVFTTNQVGYIPAVCNDVHPRFTG
jgi:streptogramin lyase